MTTIKQATLGLVESDAPAPQWLTDLVEAVIALDENDPVVVGYPNCIVIGCDHAGTSDIEIEDGITILPICECHAVPDEFEVLH